MSLVARCFVIFFSLILAIIAAGLALAIGVMVPDFVTVTTDPVEHFTFFAVRFSPPALSALSPSFRLWC